MSLFRIGYLDFYRSDELEISPVYKVSFTMSQLRTMTAEMI